MTNKNKGNNLPFTTFPPLRQPPSVRRRGGVRIVGESRTTALRAQKGVTFFAC